jgi:hypothetical protein
MKVIFLDIDGVLNSRRYHPRRYFEPDLVARLNQITRATGAKIVISSARRRSHAYDELTQILRKAGVEGDVIGRTGYDPRVCGRQRGDEIIEWLNLNPDVTRIVILDDRDDMRHIGPALVPTNPAIGLEDKHVHKAIAMLGGPKRHVANP